MLITQHRGRDFVYLVDFGIVRAMGGDTRSSLTGTGSAIGTLAYMAPELFLGREIRRVDVYALGCVLHKPLAGGAPFLAEGRRPHVRAPQRDPAAASLMRPGIPARLDWVIARGMAKDPPERFATAGEFAEAAHAALSSTGLTLPHSTHTPARTALPTAAVPTLPPTGVAAAEPTAGRFRGGRVGAAALPTGMLTLLFTDVEGSTGLLSRLGDHGTPCRSSTASKSLDLTNLPRPA